MPVADEPGPLPTTTPTLPSRLAKASAVGQQCRGRRRAAHDLQQPHDVRRAEEVQADDASGARPVAAAIASMSSVDVLVARIASGPGDGVELAEDLAS